MNEALQEAATLHGEAIPGESKSLWNLLWRTEHARFRVGMALTNALQELQQRRLQVLLPKDKEITELDRTTTMEAGSAEQSKAVKQLELSYELLGERIQLLTQYLAFCNAEPNTETQEE